MDLVHGCSLPVRLGNGSSAPTHFGKQGTGLPDSGKVPTNIWEGPGRERRVTLLESGEVPAELTVVLLISQGTVKVNEWVPGR